MKEAADNGATPVEGAAVLHRRLDCALRLIQRNVSAFSPIELEEMVKERLIEPKSIPADLRTEFVRRRLGLRK